MESVIIRPANGLLKKYVQYFLFFRKDDATRVNYVTFPNNNLCLAVYRNSTIEFARGQGANSCILTAGPPVFKSRLLGFHAMPFRVEVSAPLDQICILFHPAALRAFTRESYGDLMASEDVFDIFGSGNALLLEQLFQERDLHSRAEKLEALLLGKLCDRQPAMLREAMALIASGHAGSVEELSKKMLVSIPTVFRLFKENVGTGPKAYFRTLRFRSALGDVVGAKGTLTAAAYANRYYDQAHFIKDFRTFAGCSPRELVRRISVEQQDLAWVLGEKSAS